MGDPDFRQSAEAERAAIVAWLRAEAKAHHPSWLTDNHNRAADAIERGDHRKAREDYLAMGVPEEHLPEAMRCVVGAGIEVES
ncbi:hypothetical protein GG804_25065 [Sphingomonas histidinilytica]|uniref:hypothetical protein n=1 Tax=Rhizorhabdus histidinilytica TaxID=439228 RepID=UPI001ADA8907|nr:hypothetical protein [Rhizorhabdus histidinilytica]MBO9380043.1 hypothetical protein [Rhizorhabdus histidinilytica]